MNTTRHQRWAAAAVFALLATPAFAQTDNVVNSKHNMRTFTGPGSATPILADFGDVCAYCHTPHAGQTQNSPLWNRSFGAGPYQMYNNAYSSTIDMTVETSPQGVSLSCLSCHDGTIGLDVISNKPNADTSLAATNSKMPANAGQFFSNLATNLQNDHPISVTYSTTADPAFNAASAGKVGTLPLYGGRVECGTCHNPHNTTNPPFLRKANTASALCTTCHIK